MKTYLDCIPCFMRQALGAARLATSDETVHETVLRGVLAVTSRMDLKKSPPEMAQFIHRRYMHARERITPEIHRQLIRLLVIQRHSYSFSRCHPLVPPNPLS